MADDAERNILKEIWRKEQALREKLLPVAEAQSLQKGLISFLQKTLPKDSLPELRLRKMLTERKYQTWWANPNGYSSEDVWGKIKPFLDLLEQHEAERMIKRRLETEGLFVESRSDNEDLHLLVGNKNDGGNKAHLIIDGKTGEVRVEDNQREPTELLAHIEAILTLPSGKKVKSTREAIEEIDTPTLVDPVSVGVGTAGFNGHARLKEGLAESFTVTIPVLLRNRSTDNVLVQNIRVSLEVPTGYRCYLAHDGLNSPSGRNIKGRDVLSYSLVFSTSIIGRKMGVPISETPEWNENKEKLLAGIRSERFTFRFNAEFVSPDTSGAVQREFDLTDALLPQVMTG